MNLIDQANSSRSGSPSYLMWLLLVLLTFGTLHAHQASALQPLADTATLYDNSYETDDSAVAESHSEPLQVTLTPQRPSGYQFIQRVPIRLYMAQGPPLSQQH